MPHTIDNVADALSLPTEFVITESVVNWFARLSQYLSWFILYPIFHLCFRLEVKGQENFDKLSSPFIVISNHVAFYDSFLFRLVLGFNSYHLPLRFMAVKTGFHYLWLNVLSRIGVLDVLYALFGAFVVIPGRGMKYNLKRATEILESGGNVVIYPEGRIVKEGGIGTFKHGAAVLAHRTSVPVIPVAFHVCRRSRFRPSLQIHIGQPLLVSRSTLSRDATEIFRETINALYRQE